MSIAVFSVFPIYKTVNIFYYQNMSLETFNSGASILKILANARRLEIVNLLHHDELCVTDMYMMLDLSQANVSQHLMVLRQAGIVRSRREGKFMYYKLAHPSLWKIVLGLREAVGDYTAFLGKASSTV